MKRLFREEIEYQPDAIEIKNERMPFWLRYSVFSIFLFFAGVIAWSILCKVDVIVQAQGKLVTNQPPIQMQPLERAVIKEVNVVIGQHVREGEVLFTFDPTLYQADADRFANDLSLFQAQYDRLKAEFNDEPFTIPEDADANQRDEFATYQKRRAFYDEKMKEFEEALNSIQASKKGCEDSKKNAEGQLEKYQELEEMHNELLRDKYVAKMDLIKIQLARKDVERMRDQSLNDMVKLEHDEGTKKSERESFKKQWQTDIAEQYVKVRQQLETTRHEYEKAKQLIEYVSLKAPCDAVVHQIASFAYGSAVREAEPLITLIPLNDKLEMEAELRPQDIGKVKVGSSVRVKVSAFPFQRYGTLDDCVVRDISSDTITKNGGAPADPLAGGGSYYRVRVSLSGHLRNLDGEIVDGVFHPGTGADGGKGNPVGSGINGEHPFIPGMEAIAEIKTDKRRIIEYLVYPLIKAFDESAREP